MHRCVPCQASECNGVERVCKLFHRLVALGFVHRHCLGNDRGEIIGDYDRFLEEFPKQLPLKLHRLRLDDAEARLPKLEKLAKDKALAKQADLHVEHGRTLLALGQPKPAIDALTKALALKSGDRPDILLLMAEAEHAAGKTAEATARLDAAVKADAEAFEACLDDALGE